MEKLECKYVAEQWERWCGKTPWSENLRKFGRLGGKIIWWGGYPQSKSAMPLCFVLVMPDKREWKGSRLKDIKQAVLHTSDVL